MSNELSPEQRDRLARLIAAELRRLKEAAIESGATPEAVAETLEQRRRALQRDAPDVPETGETA